MRAIAETVLEKDCTKLHIAWRGAMSWTPEILSRRLIMPTLIIWGEQDIAQGLPCLDGTQRYVCDLRIERLPGVSEWAQEDALQEVNRLLGRFL